MVDQSPARLAFRIRRHVLSLAVRNNGAYLAQACSAAEILATLYAQLMDLGPPHPSCDATARHEPPRPGRPGHRGADHNGERDGTRDRFILSPAHYAGALYAALVETGRLEPSALETYAVDGGLLEMIGSEQSPGFEATTGSLAQGLSVGVGVALARQLRRQPGSVWVLVSDGELEEGQTWEGLAAAAHHSLSNLIMLVDANGLQVDGDTQQVMNMEPLAAKMRAFGWQTHEVDGHDPDAIVAAAASRQPDKPTCVICRTAPWQGIPSLKTRYPQRLHFVRFKPGEAEAVQADLASQPGGHR